MSNKYSSINQTDSSVLINAIGNLSAQPRLQKPAPGMREPDAVAQNMFEAMRIIKPA
jgi:hypothetical protein